MLIQLILTLIVIGILLWLIDKIPMHGGIKEIINIVAIVGVIVWLIQTTGLLHVSLF